MIELADTFPEINVDPAEYNRLLGYPRDHVLEGRARELSEWSRSWFAKNGRPWVYAREVDNVAVETAAIRIEGALFTSQRLRKILEQAEAHAAILVAVSAGPELEQEARRLWQDEKPDEYFFLEIFGSAVVEHLTTMTGARLCDWAERYGMAVLPHYSPGYPEWDIAEQPQLLRVLRQSRQDDLLARVEVLESGALSPKKSLLAVFGLTRHTDNLRRLTELVPCENCSFAPCQYRRVPYVANAAYSVNRKALKRWAEERLLLQPCEDGGIDAFFRYDGTTCTNMGRPLTFQYLVKLGPRAEGYPIREQRCGPASGDAGHTYMCRYLSDREQLMTAVEREKPLLGRRLHDVLLWERAAAGEGCYCELASREHKWGLVLETIHYALVQRERNGRNER